MATSPPERLEEFNFEKLILFGEKGFSHHVGWGSSLYLGDIDNDDQRGEWPSGLRRCSKNRKVRCSIPTRRSARLRDPTSLRGSQ